MLNFYSVSAVVSIQCSETGVDTIFNPKLASGIFLIKKRTVLNFSSILVFLKNLAGTWVEPYHCCQTAENSAILLKSIGKKFCFQIFTKVAER